MVWSQTRLQNLQKMLWMALSITRAHTPWPGRLLLWKKLMWLWQCSWLWPLDDSDSEITMNELSVIRSQRMSFRIVHMMQLFSSTTAWYERQNHGKSEPPHYYNTSTRQVIWIKLHFYKFVPGSETLPGLHWMGHPATCCNMMGMMLHWPAMYERHSEALSLSV